MVAVDLTIDKRIYFLMIGGAKMTDGNGRPLLFFLKTHSITSTLYVKKDTTLK